MRNLVEQGGFTRAQAKQLTRLGGLRLGELHLTQQRAGDHDWRHATDRIADVVPGPTVLALDIEDFLSQVRTHHGVFSPVWA